MTILDHLLRKQRERPYLRLCRKCGGKGQLSYLDKYQKKAYAPCNCCSNGCGPYALGVEVKCRCQGPAVNYSFILASQVRQFKGWQQEEELRELHKAQKVMGAQGNAILIVCDTCNARYIAQDGAGERRKISIDKEMNEEDKEYNRHIANILIGNGIIKEIGALPGTTLPARTSVERVSPSSAATQATPQQPSMSVNPLGSEAAIAMVPIMAAPVLPVSRPAVHSRRDLIPTSIAIDVLEEFPKPLSARPSLDNNSIGSFSSRPSSDTNSSAHLSTIHEQPAPQLHSTSSLPMPPNAVVVGMSPQPPRTWSPQVSRASGASRAGMAASVFAALRAFDNSSNSSAPSSAQSVSSSTQLVSKDGPQSDAIRPHSPSRSASVRPLSGSAPQSPVGGFKTRTNSLFDTTQGSEDAGSGMRSEIQEQSAVFEPSHGVSSPRLGSRLSRLAPKNSAQQAVAPISMA